MRSTGHGSGQALGGSCAHLKSNKGTGVSRGTDLGLRADLRREGAQTLSIVLMWTWTHMFKDCRLGDLVAYMPIIAHSRLARAVRSPRDLQRVPTRALRAPTSASTLCPAPSPCLSLNTEMTGQLHPSQSMCKDTPLLLGCASLFFGVSPFQVQPRGQRRLPRPSIPPLPSPGPRRLAREPGQAVPLTTAGAWPRGGTGDPSWDNGVLLLLLLFLLLRPPWGTRRLRMSHTEDSRAAGREEVTDCPGDMVRSLARNPQLFPTVQLQVPDARPFRFKAMSLTIARAGNAQKDVVMPFTICNAAPSRRERRPEVWCLHRVRVPGERAALFSMGGGPGRTTSWGTQHPGHHKHSCAPGWPRDHAGLCWTPSLGLKEPTAHTDPLAFLGDVLRPGCRGRGRWCGWISSKLVWVHEFREMTCVPSWVDGALSLQRETTPGPRC